MYIKKTNKDLLDDAEFHLKSIARFALEFDQGDRESMALATTHLRTLLKSKGRTKSVLAHLNITDIKFIDIAGISNPVSLAPVFAGSLTLGDYLPKLSTDNREWLDFENWYSELVLYYKNFYSFSREELITGLGEKYIQHVDEDTIRDFHYLHKNLGNYVGWISHHKGLKVKQPNIIFSVLRMICHEVLVSLEKSERLSFDFHNLYFKRLGEIKPFSPFGEFDVELVELKDTTFMFYTIINGEEHKLPIGGDNSLTFNRENVKDLNGFLTEVRDSLVSEEVYEYLAGEEVTLGEVNILVDRKEELQENFLSIVHKPTQKFQLINFIRLNTKLGINVSRFSS